MSAVKTSIPTGDAVCSVELAAQLGPAVMGIGRVPITREGQLAYYTKQRVRTFEIFVTPALLGGGTQLTEAEVDVEIAETCLKIGLRGRSPYIQGVLWKTASPAESKWEVVGNELHITMGKGVDSYGSWMHLLQNTRDDFANRKGDIHNRELFETWGQHHITARNEKLRGEAIEKSALIQRCLAQPVHKIAFLFPGQGAQSVGMLKAAQHLLPVQRMNAVAYKVLGYDLMDLCLNGPEEKLNMTQYSQPAMLLADLAAVEQLLATGQGSVVKQCSAVAGLSLGEWAALVFAGAITFEEAMRCIKVRGKMMADAAVLGDLQGMINVVGLDFAQLTAVCKSVADQYPGSVCQIANHLFPMGYSVSGHISVLGLVQLAAKEAGAIRANKIAVSGAFHTELMSPATVGIKAVMKTISVQDPRIPIVSNVTGKPMTTAEEILELLPRQVCEPVLWEHSLRTLIAGDWKRMYEVGPGGQLKRICSRVDPSVEAHLIHIAP